MRQSEAKRLTYLTPTKTMVPMRSSSTVPYTRMLFSMAGLPGDASPKADMPGAT